MKMTVEELLRRYAAGERYFAGADLRYGQELSVAILKGIDLSRAFMDGINIVGVDLSYSNLSQGRIDVCRLEDVNLTAANLRGASLIEASIIGVNLTGADLTDAKLSDASFRRVNLTGANLTRTRFMRTDIIDSNLTNAVIEVINLGGFFFRNTIMPEGTIRTDD